MNSDVTSTGYEWGFQDVSESDTQGLSWQGSPPPWLQGNLFRNGPGRYNRGQVEVNHWFDGLALLHAFRLTPTTVSYHSRYVRSHDYRFAETTGQIASPGFACDPCRSLFRKLASAFVVDATDNPNVNLIEQGGRFLALTELPIPMEFDPATLRSKAPHLYKDRVPTGSTTAHPHQEGKMLFNQVLHYSAWSSYRLYTQRELDARQEFARVSVDEVSYVHSFGLSPQHIILTCCPLQVAPWKLLIRDKPFIENFQWKPRWGTRFHVVPRPGVKGITRTYTTEPLFCFHHVNSFLEDHLLHVDLVAYPDANLIRQLKLENLRQGGAIDFGHLRRYTIDQAKGTIERTWESQHVLELPRIHYARYNTKDYRFVFGVSAEKEHSLFYDRLLKLDVTKDHGTYWQEERTYPGEPVFVPDPAGCREDDGVLLSVVLSPQKRESFLLVLDAQSMTELARAWLPGVVPHGFHGMFQVTQF